LSQTTEIHRRKHTHTN